MTIVTSPNGPAWTCASAGTQPLIDTPAICLSRISAINFGVIGFPMIMTPFLAPALVSTPWPAPAVGVVGVKVKLHATLWQVHKIFKKTFTA